MNCKNCNSKVDAEYCSKCGHPTVLKRIDGKYVIHEIEHLLHFERGILYTIKELLIKPGKNIRNYLSENRSRLVKPIIFIIVTSLIYSLVVNIFHIEDEYVGYMETKESTTNKIFRWVQANYGYSNILMGTFVALWLKMFFRKYDFNFFEILILLCFVMGMGMFILAVFAIIQGLTHLKVLQFGASALFIYLTWAIGQFFDGKKFLSYLKALFAYILGMSTLWILIFITGAIIDKFIKP